ncbi:cytochrome-c oxidase, cbb3-type subunit II [Ponticaulis sp.]|uniref:cytochrome-c oxidase, cbb3-type subunit II n=1 Tax=Ponticaulis sp. TaxID=2020902 RepID=UPI000B7526B1|nr:cytochrome-c oxidase, cbb3-type subunit II [Ponticaulis sp.]MAI89577.1 cytochrome-c oxidase, cbb3-type subunit II [Ponticaulis sp.]OUY00604.1 MAG: cytochrome-c oxidase, cbb3-type subunit II [Hyphomonadaceae bacterium TMED5]|tara:strand:- start:35416 stop:36192 length:777 start_codon:yes stop_codon:yes gene_type:complete
MALFDKHAVFEKHSLLLTVGILVVVAIGGIIEIAPLFYMSNTIERVNGMRPYTPLELAGREIYVREGCYVCHSQMVRPLRDEVERYGHYSLAAESMYDHPFQWGSKRTGPDLARVGGKYSDEWHMDHMADPRSVVPESIMPPYEFMVDRPLDYSMISETMAAMRVVGVPYTDAMIENADLDLRAQADPDFYPENVEYDYGLEDRYNEASGREGTVNVRVFDGVPEEVTEMDALIAYLQMLGTLVDFDTYEAGDLQNRR